MSDTATVGVQEKPVESKLKAILAQKVGMTRVFDAQGRMVPVTVFQAGPCRITQVKSQATHGYSAIQVSFGVVREKSVNKPFAGVFKKINAPLAKWLREFRTDKAASFQVGQELRADSFIPGDFVDVTGISKGKGFAGAMKRHNFGGGPSTHGQSDRARATGSSGSNTYPGRVFKGKRFPGHLGVESVTVQHLEVVQVFADKDLMLIRGAVPGPKQGLVKIAETVKRIKHRVPHVPESKKEKTAKKDASKAAPVAAKKGTK